MPRKDCSKNQNCQSAAGEESHIFSSQKSEKEIHRTSSLDWQGKVSLWNFGTLSIP